MEFNLKLRLGRRSTEIENPSPEIIDQAIGELLPVRYYNVILDCEEPVNGFRFIQAVILMRGDPELKYVVEIQHEVGETKFYNGTSFTQYALETTDVEAVKRMFRMFALGITPDISSWQDVSLELIEEFNEKKKDSRDG